MGAVIYTIRNRKKIEELESKIAQKSLSESVETKLESKVGPFLLAEAPEVVAKQKISELSENFEAPRMDTGKIVEKSQQKANLMPNVAERYEAAELMLAKGFKIQDVAAKTGLSVSELRLLEKISSKSH